MNRFLITTDPLKHILSNSVDAEVRYALRLFSFFAPSRWFKSLPLVSFPHPLLRPFVHGCPCVRDTALQDGILCSEDWVDVQKVRLYSMQRLLHVMEVATNAIACISHSARAHTWTALQSTCSRNADATHLFFGEASQTATTRSGISSMMPSSAQPRHISAGLWIHFRH